MYLTATPEQRMVLDGMLYGALRGNPQAAHLARVDGLEPVI
jgi:hypothetical protein